jgi:RecA-family ATPase
VTGNNNIQVPQKVKEQHCKLPAIHGARDIVMTEYPPLAFLVSNLIPKSGLILLAGASKVGKSWFVLQLLILLTQQEEQLFLGIRISYKCRCLYLALEDTEDRIKSRILKMGYTPNNNLLIATSWPHNEAGVQMIEQYLTVDTADIIVLDTKGAFGAGKVMDSFQADYDWMRSLKRIADTYSVAILLITHTRKLPAVDDEYETISGTSAVMAASDSIIMLKRSRQENEGMLYCTSRDFPETSFPIAFNPDNCTWNKLDHPSEETKTKERQRIIDILRENGTEMSPLRISEKYGGTAKNVSNMLASMYKEGVVEHGTHRGFWIIAMKKESESFLSYDIADKTANESEKELL